MMLVVLSITNPSIQIYPVQAKNSQQSYDLIGKISGLTIGFVSVFQINISMRYDIYNPHLQNYNFQAAC